MRGQLHAPAAFYAEKNWVAGWVGSKVDTKGEGRKNPKRELNPSRSK
jgi:hypothetical protein